MKPIDAALIALLCAATLAGCQKSSDPAPEETSKQSLGSSAAPPSSTGSVNRGDLAKPAMERTLPESLLNPPAKDAAPRNIQYGTVLATRTANPRLKAGWQYRRSGQGQIVGFEFSNHGGNRILSARRDATKNQFYTRDFQFRFDDRARQDIHMMISDWAPSQQRGFRLSELMNRLMHIFPRSYLPAIVNAGDRNIVTLPTGEEVQFNAVTHEILGGVFSEAPVDLTSGANGRKSPGVDYHGKGVLVRVDSRGSDPRLGTMATISTGTPPESCANPGGCNQCAVPSQELWDQSGAVRFKFQSDQEFDRFLHARCGFGLPRQGQAYALATPAR